MFGLAQSIVVSHTDLRLPATEGKIGRERSLHGVVGVFSSLSTHHKILLDTIDTKKKCNTDQWIDRSLVPLMGIFC